MPWSPFSQRHQALQEMLVKARRRAGLTQAEVAERLGRSQSFVSKYERGERRVEVVDLLDIAKALRIDPANFIRRLRKAISA